ncbi:MAG: alpha/beta fold hydrolase, partial [Pirellulales bacterium]
ALGSDQPCYGFQSPALAADEPPPASIEAMAQRYLDVLLRVAPSGTCLLAGWSLGGLVAYEMAHRLRASGRPVPGLVLIDAGILFSFQLLREFVPTGEVPAFMWNGADRERMYGHMRQHAGPQLFPAGADEAFSRRTFDVFWANVAAAYHYSPPDYEGEMTLVTGRQAQGKYHPLGEWRRRCEHVRSIELPGKHLELLEPPCVGKLAAIIKSLAGEPKPRSNHARRPTSPRTYEPSEIAR